MIYNKKTARILMCSLFSEIVIILSILLPLICFLVYYITKVIGGQWGGKSFCYNFTFIKQQNFLVHYRKNVYFSIEISSCIYYNYRKYMEVIYYERKK